MEKYKSAVLPRYQGKKYAIPDIHGCLETLNALLRKINLRKEDQLFILGDFIGRGYSSVGVTDRIIGLISEGYQVYPIRGNHEEEIVQLSEGQNYFFNYNKIEDEILDGFFDHNHKLKPVYLNFFSSLPYIIEIEDFIMVHAGIDFSAQDPFTDFNSMLYIRNFRYDEKTAKNKNIVHGHSPKSLSFIQNAIGKSEKIIPIDNGCVWKEFEGMGNLLCLELGNMELTIQPNID